MSVRRQRGAVAVIMALTVPAIIAVAIGVMMLAQTLLTRQRLQYAADATAAAGALLARRDGIRVGGTPNNVLNTYVAHSVFDPAFAQNPAYAWLPTAAVEQAFLVAARDGNLALGGAQAWPTWTYDNVGGVEWSRTQIRLQTLGAFNKLIRADAAYRVQQIRTAGPRRRAPALMLVLDYSASMNQISPAFGAARTQLVNVMTGFLDGLPQDDVKIGLVRYGSVVAGLPYYDSIPPQTRRDSNNFAEVRQAIAKPASGETATGPAIGEAMRHMLAQAENFGRNIILVTDGLPWQTADVDPLASETAATAAATAAKGQGAQLVTVEVQHVVVPPSAQWQHLHDLLRGMSTPTADDHWHQHAQDAAKLRDLFAAFQSKPQCDVDVGVDAGTASAFLWNPATGDESPLQPFGNADAISCPLNCDVYGYRTEGTKVILSPVACDEVLSGRRQVLVRFGPAVLAL